MSFITKRGLSILLIAFIVLGLSGVYILKSGFQKFVILDMDKVNDINDPALKIAIEATEKCNEIETPYKNGTELYRKNCYQEIAWYMGEHYGFTTCEKLKKEFKLKCYFGYGINLGKKYAPNIVLLQDECSKTDFYENCLREAAFVIGRESAKHIETEQCKKFEQESIKQRCYEGMGRQLAEDNIQLGLCKKTEDEESCLKGFAYITYNKGDKEEALQICNSLSDPNAKKCHYSIGYSDKWVYNKTIDEAFKNCEQYPYSEDCKNGAAAGIAAKFFEEQQKNNGISTSATFAVYEAFNTIHTINDKINDKIDFGELLPRPLFETLTKTRLAILEHTLICLIILIALARIIFIIKNNKKNIKRVLYKTLEKTYYFLTKKIPELVTSSRIIIGRKITKAYGIIILIYQKIIKICYSIKSVVRDLLTLDKTAVSSFCKEVKSELKSREGKKRLLSILLIIGLTALLSVGHVTLADYSVQPEELTNDTGQIEETVNSPPVIDSYTPEQEMIIILTNESQTFTITTSDPDNDILSIQWYVNNLPITDQTSETFTYTTSEPGEYEIKALVTDNKGYATHKWALTINEENIVPELNEMLPEEVTEPVVENVTEPEIINETQETLPEMTNEIIETTGDDTLIQLPAEINKPVQWKRTIKNKNLDQKLKIRIPKSAVNIKSKKIIKLLNEEVKENIPDYKIIEGDSFSPTGFITADYQPRKAYVINLLKSLKNLFKFTGFATAEAIETKEIIIDQAASKYEISYETPAPLIEETELESGKKVIVHSDYHYINILTYASVKERDNTDFKLYWLTNNTEIPHDAELIDTNNNNLVDKIQWTTEHLSEQTFFINTTYTTSYDYANGTLNKTEWNTSIEAITLTENDTEQELPGDQVDELAGGLYGGINMTGNVLLLHLNNDSSYGENDTHAYDFSGNQHNWTAFGNAQPNLIDYKTGTGSFTLDGNGDYLTADYSNDFSFGTDPFTLDFWVRLSSTAGIIPLIAQGDGVAGGACYSGWTVYLNVGNLYLNRFVNVPPETQYPKSVAWTPSTNTWYYITIVRSGNNLYFFVNGAQQGATQDVTGITYAAYDSYAVQIGFMRTGAAGGTYNYLNGNIDEVAILNRSLSADEVKEVYDRQKGYYIAKGSYTSDVFNIGSTVKWNNISWAEGTPYGEELPSGQADELNSGILGGANMTGNVLLLHLNNDSSYGENDTYAYDFSGNQNNGTFYNNVTTGIGSDTGPSGANETGMLNGSFAFDGDGDYISVADHNSLDLTTEATVETWVKLNSFATPCAIVGRNSNGYFLGIYGEGDEPGKITWGKNAVDEVRSTSTLSVGNWYHIVGTHSGGTNKIYINGVLDNSGSGADFAALTDDIYIGKHATAGWNFNGTIDELALWNRSLSATEILDIYKRGALKLNLTVKDCDDAACSGDAWNVGCTNSTFCDISSLSNSQYFQYQADFYSDGGNDTLYTPELYNVSIDYTPPATPYDPTVVLNFTYDNTNYTNESMWCEVYVNDADTENDMSIDIIIMNSTSNDITTAVEQYSLSNAVTGITEPAYWQFEINETNFTKNSYVWCQAKINDQELNSSWTNSTSLKVENYPIQISSPLDNFTIDEDFTNFTLYWGNNWTDADNNSYESDETYINWTFFMNDTEILGIDPITINLNDTDTASIGSLPNLSGTVEINWTIIDSDNAAYNETVYWTVNAFNDAPWWNETANNTYSYLEDLPPTGLSYIIWDEAGLNNTFWDVEDPSNHTPYNCTVSVNDTFTVTNVTYESFDGDVRADSVANISGAFILTVNCSDQDWLSELTSFDITINAANDQPWWDQISNTTYTLSEDSGVQPFGTDLNASAFFRDVPNEGTDQTPNNITISTNTSNVDCFMNTPGGAGETNFSVFCNPINNYTGNFIITLNGSDGSTPPGSTLESFEASINPLNDEPTAPLVTLNFTYDNTNYTNESMWCEVYIEDIDNTTGLSVDLIIMNSSTSSDIDTAVEQYFLPNAYVSQNNGTYVSFEINETNFTKNSYVWCQAKINDQELNSSWTNSTSLKVENYPVQISSPLDNFTIDEDFANFTLYWGNNWTDADNATDWDATEVFINWTFFMNDTEILGIDPITINLNDTDTASIGSLPNLSGTVEINWTIIDSDNATYNETVYWTVNAVNDAPWWDSIGNTTANISEADGGGKQPLGINASQYWWDVEDGQALGINNGNLTISTNETDVKCSLGENLGSGADYNGNWSVFCAPSNGFIGDFIITLNGSDSNSPPGYVLESFEAYVNDSTPPTLAWLNKDPSDIDSLSLFGRLLNISYNISDLKGVNPDSVLIYYKTNSSTSNNLYFVNGSYLVDDYLTSEIKVLITNESDIWNFTLEGDGVYPWTGNINKTLMEETAHKEYILSSRRDYVKIEFYNVSNDKNFSIFEIMAENLTEDSNVLRIYYCNSSYTTGDPSTDEDCAKFSDWGAATPFNHTHSDYSKHHLIPFPINTSAGETVGNIYVTNTSYFLLRGTLSLTDNWNVSYITNKARDGAAQTSVNSGNNWIDLSGTVDAHLHQYNGDETFYYFVSACDAFNNCANSSEESDPISLGGLPPSAPDIYAPVEGYYGDWLGLANMSINYTSAISPNGYPISFYNISLVDTDQTFNLTINPNNALDLSYSWNISETISGEYYIRVEACDNQDQCSFGYSDNITLDNTAPVVTLVSPADGNNSNGTGFTTEFEFNCSITDDVGIANVTLYGNWTGEWHANQTMNLTEQVTDNSTTFLASLIRGSYDWNCLAADFATNENFTGANRTFTILNNRPTDVLVDTPLNETNYSVMPVFAWSNSTDIEDDAIQYILEIDEDPTFQTTPTLKYSNVSIAETANTTKDVSVSDSLTTEGKYFWIVLSTDLYDNATAWSEVRYFTYDTTLPTIIANHTVNNSKFCNIQDDTRCSTEINFTIQDYIALNTESLDLENVWWVNSSGDSNCTEFDCTEFASHIVIDAGSNILQYSINVTDWPEGYVNITIWANDSSGNEQIAELFTAIDNSGPSITLNSPKNDTKSGITDQNFQATVWDNSTIINCSLIINNEDPPNQTINTSIQPNTPTIITFTLSSDQDEGLTNGTYEWTVNCTDEVNNEGTNNTAYTVYIDTSNPVIFLNVEPPGPLEFYLDNCSINWSIEELNLITNYTNVTMPDGADLSGYDNFTLSAQENLTILGNYTVTTHAEDWRGPESYSTNRTEFVVRDTIVPNVIIVSPENNTISNSSEITFSFNTSDYHSIYNCTLWLNETIGYDGYDNTTTIDNNITITQNISRTGIADEKNVPWNISCYDSSTNSNNFSNLSSDVSLNVTHLNIDIDTIPPSFSFLEPTDGNDTYVSRNWTYINVSVTEPHNDTVIIVWNHTANYIFGIDNEIIENPSEGNTRSYERNVTGWTDGVYEYYIFANDTLANESEGHYNTSEIRTITIDETQPPIFDLSEPSNNIEVTDDTPVFNWEDSTDTNIDNYTLELSNDNFATIKYNKTTTESYSNSSDVLDPGTWYWKVKATDKANNQGYSTTFQFTIGNVSLPTTYIMGPGGGGGGGGGKKIVYGVVNIVQPSMQTLYEGGTVTTPIIIQNPGEGPINGITLTAITNSPSIKLKLSKTYIRGLSSGQQEEVELKITAEATVGEYEVIIKAEATDPKITDQAKFYVNLVGFGLGKKVLMEEKLRFVGKLFESNPECLELKEMVEEATKKLEEKDYDASLELIESAIKSCEELVKTSTKKVLEKPAAPKRTLQILIGEISAFILMFIMIYRYYRTRKYKGPVIMKKGKPGLTLILLILIFLSGFFFLKTYTGFTVFEDVPGSDSFGGDYSGTTLNEELAVVNLSLPTTLGNFTSRVFTANFTVEWQTINWSWSSTAEDNVTMDVRTSIDNITWSSWSENVTNTSKIPDAKNIWTDKEDFIGDLDNVSITDLPGNITLYTGNETGTFTSESLDLGFTGVNIATIEFTITNTSEDNVTIETSTSADNSTWGAWAQTSVSGDQVLSTDNRYFKWRATLVTNDISVTPVLEDLTVNYERNSTYLQYRATLSTNDTTQTPSLEWVNITYQDANLPLFEFLNPTDEDDSYITDNHTYINFTITEPNNDSFYLDWNGTRYNPVDMNETETISEGTNVYAINLTELSEGIYEYHIWANDTYGHENRTGNRKITVDYTAPSSFNLSNPPDESRSTSVTPFFTWEACSDTSLDNYTLEIATTTNFGNTTDITRTCYSTSSNPLYQLNSSEALPDNGTYYWRVIAYDKVGYNHTTDPFTYYVGIAAPVEYVSGSTGAGGGGGKPVKRVQSGIELIKPSALSFFSNREVIIPLLLVNTGTQILQGIELTAESADLELELKNNYFPILRPHQEIDPQLVVKPIEDPGRYSIVVKAKVADPEFTDAIMFMIDVTEFGFGNKAETEDKLTFVVDFIKSNDECAELEQSMIDAKEAFKKNEFDLALSLAEKAVQSCKDLVSTAKEKKLEKKKRPAWQYYVPLLEVLLFLLIFSMIYSYYKRMKFKRRKYW